MGANIHVLMQKEYERRKKLAFDKLEQRRNEVYLKVPRIREIDDEINLLGVRYNKLILAGLSPADAVMPELSEKLEKLKKEKENLLVSHGFGTGYLEISYMCGACKDTGYVEGKEGPEKCACYKQELINQLFRQSNLGLSEAENFSSFSESYYPDTVNEDRYGIKKSPREHMLNIRDKCLKFIENFESPDEKNLFFCGPTGVGKTFMAKCIAVEILKKGRTVLYQTAPVLFDIIAEYKQKAFRDEDFEDDVYKNIFDVELLIIDDLGTETQTPARYAELLNILNTRQANNLTRPCKTIISTNLDIGKLSEYYTERVTSRIIGNYALYRFVGEDIRGLKRQIL